ncbi:trypsin-like peptidase domain-containing protein [Pseudogracilibacillus sp. SE30717A]|uniref:S1 family peptidase n=1 Tax=Pseudogracilibacillus sp. SE30717A TaxID=3098293 RepID=UPI00300E5606
MDNQKEYTNDIIDEDLYEEFEDEELYELVEEARKEALQRIEERKQNKKQRTPFPKWIFWIIAFALMFNIVALLPQTFSIPAVDFLITSAKLSTQDNIKTYKEAVVVIETDNSKGTGFSINEQGDIITNYHVIEGNQTVTVAFPEDGLFSGEIVETYPEIDLAVVRVDSHEQLPYLPLADTFLYEPKEQIYFIGNPLKFQGIANKGNIMDYVYVNSKDLPMVMLDAPVYKGNSGSPIIDEAGEVIGVIFATMDHKEEGRVGLFIPIDYFYDYRSINKEQVN